MGLPHLILAALVACGGDPAPTPAPPEAAPAQAEAPKPLRLPPGARVVTDISGSMQGFVTGGGSRLTRLHEELTGALGAAAVPGRLERCLVASEVSCAGADDLGRYARADLYTGRESRFDLALDLRGDEGPDSRHLTVVVTDGVYGGRGGDTTDMAGCAAGATVACIGQRLGRLVEEGYGVWVVGASLPFDGRVYAERSMDAAQFERLRAGLGDHQRVSAFKPHASEASYAYAGPRPLLVLLVTRDVALGRRLARDLEGRLARADLASADGDGVHQAEWAPLDEALPGLKPQISGARVDRVRTEGFQLGKQAPTAGGYALLVRCGAADHGALRVEGAHLGPDTELLLDPATPAGAVPRFKHDGEALSLGLVCRDLPAGRATDLRLTVAARPDPVALVPPWVGSWSAPDTWSKPDGLFGLASLAEVCARQAVAALDVRAGLFVRVERQ